MTRDDASFSHRAPAYGRPFPRQVLQSSKTFFSLLMHQCHCPLHPCWDMSSVRLSSLYTRGRFRGKGSRGGSYTESLSSPSCSTSINVHVPSSLLRPIFPSTPNTMGSPGLRPHSLSENPPLATLTLQYLTSWAIPTLLPPIPAKLGTREESESVIKILLHTPGRYFGERLSKEVIRIDLSITFFGKAALGKSLKARDTCTEELNPEKVTQKKNRHQYLLRARHVNPDEWISHDPVRRDFYHPHFTDEGPETQRGAVPCLGSHGQPVADLGRSLPRLLDSQIHARNHCLD